MFFEKVKVSKWKLEIDNLELPSERKISNHFEEGEAPVEFTSSVEEHYRQNTFSAKVLLWNSSDNGKTPFKSVAWRRVWSWTLAISLLFSNDLDRFKLETQIKTFKSIVDEIKEAIKLISSLNPSRKLLVSEVLKLVKLVLPVPTTNVVSERSHSTLCRVCIYCWLVFYPGFCSKLCCFKWLWNCLLLKNFAPSV